MKILLADDSQLIRDNLKKLLSRIEGITMIVESYSVISTIRQIDVDQPDLVVLDLQLPDGTGFHLLETLRAREDAPRVMILSNFPTEANRKRALALGAEGFFDKSREFSQLVDYLTAELAQNKGGNGC